MRVGVFEEVKDLATTGKYHPTSSERYACRTALGSN